MLVLAPNDRKVELYRAVILVCVIELLRRMVVQNRYGITWIFTGGGGGGSFALRAPDPAPFSPRLLIFSELASANLAHQEVTLGPSGAGRAGNSCSPTLLLLVL